MAALEQAVGIPRRDARDAWLRALERTAVIGRDPAATLPRLMRQLAQRHGNAPALIDEHETLSFKALDRRINRYARWTLAQGLRPGDVVCLILPNCADYLALWLGIVRTGAVAALVNPNLKGDGLAHAIRIASPRLVVASARYQEALETIASVPNTACWTHGGDVAGLPRIETEAEHLGATPLPASECAFPLLGNNALLLYTSGTTGLPKAAKVSHHRLMQWSRWFSGMLDVTPRDRVYDCLPLYHSVGGIVATGAMLVGGASVVIRERFSASRFWEDVTKTGCTLFSYVGELCRYLVNAEPSALERRHGLRACFGNGMSAATWRRFEERFQIPKIIEFYAATEGSFSLFNCDGEVGSIGRIPSFLAHRADIALVRTDPETGLPLRGPDGFGFRCQTDETGEAIGRIDMDGIAPGAAFEGYVDAEATERKILRNVFSIGDAWYRTGDLMRRDARGYFFFADRIGDTFRWKGENVSTLEVEAAIATCPGVNEVAVYGVRVPAAEGRAGMASISPANGFDRAQLWYYLEERLPAYARPLFLRLCDALETTETFKPRKHKLAEEGFDPANVADPLFVANATHGRYIPLTPDIHARIAGGDLRL